MSLRLPQLQSRLIAHWLRCKNSTLKGFTLVELVIVMTITVILVGIGAPVTISFLQNYALTTDRDAILSLLELSRSQSLTNHLQTSHGVEITASSYVGFVGTSYATRNTAFDLVYPHSKSVATSGTTEVIFAPLSGQTTAGTITLNNGTKQLSIAVNSQGVLDW